MSFDLKFPSNTDKLITNYFKLMTNVTYVQYLNLHVIQQTDFHLTMRISLQC